MKKQISRYCLGRDGDIYAVIEDSVAEQKLHMFPIAECGPRGHYNEDTVTAFWANYTFAVYVGISESTVELAKKFGHAEVVIMQAYVDVFHFNIVRYSLIPVYVTHHNIWKEFQKDLQHRY